MKLEELFKDDSDTLKKITDKLEEINKSKEDKVKFVDLSEGTYVNKFKFEETNSKLEELNKKFTAQTEELTKSLSFKEALDKQTQELEKLKETQVEQDKKKTEEFKKLILEREIDTRFNSLGINNKILKDGLKKSLEIDKLSVTDDFEVSGIDEQLERIKTENQDLFSLLETKKMSTASTETKTKDTKRKYKSLDEVRSLSVDELQKDLDNIQSQIGSLK